MVLTPTRININSFFHPLHSMSIPKCCGLARVWQVFVVDVLDAIFFTLPAPETAIQVNPPQHRWASVTQSLNSATKRLRKRSTDTPSHNILVLSLPKNSPSPRRSSLVNTKGTTAMTAWALVLFGHDLIDLIHTRMRRWLKLLIDAVEFLVIDGGS